MGNDHYDEAETGSTVIILGADKAAGQAELGESDAIRLLGTLEAAAGGPSWLGEALRCSPRVAGPGRRLGQDALRPRALAARPGQMGRLSSQLP